MLAVLNGTGALSGCRIFMSLSPRDRLQVLAFIAAHSHGEHFGTVWHLDHLWTWIIDRYGHDGTLLTSFLQPHEIYDDTEDEDGDGMIVRPDRHWIDATPVLRIYDPEALRASGSSSCRPGGQGGRGGVGGFQAGLRGS